MEAIGIEHSLDTEPDSGCQLDPIADRSEQSDRDSHRGEPDALTAHVRFWEGAKLNRPSPSFMLNLEERARSTHPEPASGCLRIGNVHRAGWVNGTVRPTDMNQWQH
jgi:hypothetical protein